MEQAKKNIKQFLIEFSVPFIIFVIAYIIYLFFALSPNRVEYYESPNTERVYGEQRVFDYADMLTDEEEDELEAYIKVAEEKTCLDLVIVTLNESLRNYEPEYMANYNMTITPDKYVMVFADKFWEDNRFGYDAPQVLDGTTATGDGIILVDNLYREDETGKIYTWMGTTGRAEEAYSSEEIDNALDAFYEYVEEDYYDACINYIDAIVGRMGRVGGKVHKGAIIVGIIVFVFFCAINWVAKEGENTVEPKTYIRNGKPDEFYKSDHLINRHVKKTYSPESSSSGGGGHHSSGGGGSHGGGGHSR